MKIKRFAAFLLALSMLAATACGKETGTSVKTDSTETTVAEASVDESPASTTSSEEQPKEEDDSWAEAIENAPVLSECMENTLGCFAGCAVTGTELYDKKVWKIITTHFNRITLGNELKPDALFNYSNGTCPGTIETELNGETITVPRLDFSRAEHLLDKILEWNQENPDKEILVRGHVLVWHSQTPEWFFHVDYDKHNDYVDKDTMNKRLEWYISAVLSHFLSEDSKYKDMFYGWDVVNEAISDGNGGVDGLRTDAENSESLSKDTHGANSSWYHIYQSNEFIINAFKYANKYAPADLELYYNDYNECNVLKRQKILGLLTAIKEAEGEPGVGTRITAMGMQGHYGMDSPDAGTVNSSIKAYANIVGKVQITEMDITASSDYDGSEEAKIEENEKLRKRYNMIRFNIESASKEENVEFEGITFWGTVDHYSWLQSRSDVGGGSITGLPQMPLLFDENYQPKPCFFVFAKEN